jgi:hypothetical protein
MRLEIVQEPTGRGMSAVGSHYTATTSEDVTGH